MGWSVGMGVAWDVAITVPVFRFVTAAVTAAAAAASDREMRWQRDWRGATPLPGWRHVLAGAFAGALAVTRGLRLASPLSSSVLTRSHFPGHLFLPNANRV